MSEILRDHEANSAAEELQVFERLARAHRSEIKVHCYRMLGSLADAEDMVQETFARAWRARADLVEPTAARAWLYRIATNACLDTLRRHKRERRLWGDADPLIDFAALGSPNMDIDWLEPLPHSVIFDELVDERNPRAAYEQAEALRLAFLACIQRLPAQQRAIFLLHEVLGWSAAEVASAFEISPQAANSHLQRARRIFGSTYQQQPKWNAASDIDQQLAEDYAAALEAHDLDAFASLLHPDATLHMPPWLAWVKGSNAVCAFNDMIWRRDAGFQTRVIRANGCFAIATYACATPNAEWLPHSIHVLEMSEGTVSNIIAFVGPLGSALFSRAGLALRPNDSTEDVRIDLI